MRAFLVLLVACKGDPTTPSSSAGPADSADTAAPSCPASTWVEPPACDAEPRSRSSLLPGPADPGHDPDLARKARRFDRLFHGLHSWGTGLNIEVVVQDEEKREAIRRWVEEEDGWDIEAGTGFSPPELVDAWAKVAGAYAGVGIAADAFRYGALRDEGAPCEELDRAREQLLLALEGLHRAVAITGVEGVIARGYARTDLPGVGQQAELVPLFDDAGNPLPEEKTNGTWRADNSGGLYPDFAWEDSCSRDMLIGWAIGFGAAWEVIREDPSIPDTVKQAMKEDARALARSLMRVNADGYDLEIHDADGRVTYHGLLHEASVDRYYVPSAANGMNAVMALGIVGAFAAISGEEEIRHYLEDSLAGERDLAGLAERSLHLIDQGVVSNYSNHNMAFGGAFLAQRMLCPDGAQEPLRRAIDQGLYQRPGEDRQPAEQSQALYHLVALQARLGGSAWEEPGGSLDEAVLERTLTVLEEYPQPPFFAEPRVNCDEAEIESRICEAGDGTMLTLLGDVSRGENLVAEEPVPMRIRPASNYFWRSNPYEVNGGGTGAELYPAVDFRFVYWMGRYIRR